MGAKAEFYAPDHSKHRRAIAGEVGSQVEIGNAPKASPGFVLKFDAVRVVHLKDNQLTSIPIEIFQLPNVRKIDVFNNKISQLPTSPEENSDTTVYDNDPQCGWKCYNLKELTISENELTQIPVCVWGLPHLKKLICSKNRLETLLSEKEAISNEQLSCSLEMIDLSQNLLKGMVSSFLFKLPGLHYLNLSMNQISELPMMLWDCKSLLDLNVSDNQLSTLPQHGAKVVLHRSLQHSSSHQLLMKNADKFLEGKVEVKVSKSSQPEAAPSTMEPLDLYTGNQSTDKCEYSSLSNLNLSKNNFSDVPETLACFAPNLNILNISNNSLKEIDVQLLPYALKSLTAEQCKIERLGNVISKEHQKHIKDCLHDRGLDCQHRNHLCLPYLTTMRVPHNQLQHIQLLRQQVKDRAVDFGEKEDTYESKIVPNLSLLYPALMGLDLSHNQLKGRFNPNIGHQAYLKWIRLSDNRDLLEIPMEFGYLKKKQFTGLQMNNLVSLVDPPQEYRNAALCNLLTYMRSRLKE